MQTHAIVQQAAKLRHVLSLAQGQGWTYGQAHDMRVQNGYARHRITRDRLTHRTGKHGECDSKNKPC
jgi:hypothetical protein